jgi:four helix bundle protein
MSFKFENLKVWQKAIILTTEIHNLTKRFPKDEQYVLTSQIKKACDSIALNIAEVSAGNTYAEYKQFVFYALRSAIEVIVCLHLAKSRALILADDFEKCYSRAEEIIIMLHELRNLLTLEGERSL